MAVIVVKRLAPLSDAFVDLLHDVTCGVHIRDQGDADEAKLILDGGQPPDFVPGHAIPCL
ncbi:hypothetical protein [Nitrospirillum viridazoti]|uniref:hypothetical protein n=1 Tax=Nitrospirillum viridazoti TaxID=3144925 RepID=UPI0011A0BDFC|nr:hypothetical protein [Nitrospirillum amazonense]